MTKIHYWTLDEPSGNLLDSIGSADGVRVGTVTSVPGIIDNAITVASAAGANCGNPLDLQFTTGDFTFNFWFSSTAGSFDILFSKSNTAADRSYEINFNVSGQLEFSVSGDGTALTTATSPVAADGGIYMGTVVRDGTDLYIYINGAPSGSAAGAPATLFNATSNFVIANSASFNAGLNLGWIDNLECWDVAKTEAEVSAMYYSAVNTMSLTSQTPAPNATGVAKDTTVDFTIADTTHQVSLTSVEVTVAGTLAYDNGSWVNSFTGSAVAAGNGYAFSITPPSNFVRTAGGQVIGVYAENDVSGVLDTSYRFVTTSIPTVIYATSPMDSEKLVPVDALVYAEFWNIPDLITVEGVTAYTDAGGFQNGWTGATVTYKDGNRIYLIPPSPFAIGTAVDVHLEDDSANSLDVQYVASSTQITTSDDKLSPRLTEESSEQWILYAGEDGRIYMRKGNPLTAEVDVVPGFRADVIWSSALSKFVIVYIDNGRLVYFTADPSDLPSTISAPDVADDAIITRTGQGAEKVEGMGIVTKTPIKRAYDEDFETRTGQGAEKVEGMGIVTKTPIKRAVAEDLETRTGQGAYPSHRGGNFTTQDYGMFTDTPTVAITGTTPIENEVRIRIWRPTRHNDLLVGFYVVKYTKATPNIVGYVAITADDDYVEFVDPKLSEWSFIYSVFNRRSRYAALPVFEVNGKQILGLTGPSVEAPIMSDETATRTGQGRHKLFVEGFGQIGVG
jgi:hypothetical protein